MRRCARAQTDVDDIRALSHLGLRHCREWRNAGADVDMHDKTMTRPALAASPHTRPTQPAIVHPSHHPARRVDAAFCRIRLSSDVLRFGTRMYLWRAAAVLRQQPALSSTPDVALSSATIQVQVPRHDPLSSAERPIPGKPKARRPFDYGMMGVSKKTWGLHQTKPLNPAVHFSLRTNGWALPP